MKDWDCRIQQDCRRLAAISNCQPNDITFEQFWNLVKMFNNKTRLICLREVFYEYSQDWLPDIILKNSMED